MNRVTTLDPETDEALVRRARRGERDAEALLIDRLYPGVSSLATRLLRNPEGARDATQETFLRAFSHLDQFDGIHRFSAWIFKILVNFIRDQCRREGRVVSEDSLSFDNPARDPLPADVAMRTEDMDRLRSELELLPEATRAAVLLHFQEGLNGKEIAYALGITHQAARLKICRAVAVLRERLREDE